MVVEVLGEMCSLGGHQELGEEVDPEDLILLGNLVAIIELRFFIAEKLQLIFFRFLFPHLFAERDAGHLQPIFMWVPWLH